MTSLYVHVPFCLQKCSYCAFYSFPLEDSADEAVFSKSSRGEKGRISKYLTGIEREIEIRHTEAPAGVSSLFLGGGTPTALGARELEILLGSIHKRFKFSTGKHNGSDPVQKTRAIEKTAEVNPGTIDKDKLGVLKDCGINRISLGAQSFNDNHLRTIGRIHTARDIKQGVYLIREAGFTNLNLDLMFGLPGQTLGDWQETVRSAVDISPEHLSIYALTLEEGTPLALKYRNNNPACRQQVPAAGIPKLPDDDLQADMYEWAVSYLGSQGYFRYEVANFARAGFESKHNLSYWHGEDYIGLGPGAVSCLMGVRYKNTQDIDTYHDSFARGERPVKSDDIEYLTRDQRISEHIMLGLRTVNGIDLDVFEEKFCARMQDIYGHKLANYIDRKIIIQKGRSIKINPDYLFIANFVLSEFIL